MQQAHSKTGRRDPAARLELGLLAVFSATWLLAIFANLGVVPLAGTLDLDLYRLFSIAAVLGWLAGNIYVARAQSFAGASPRERFAGAPTGRPDRQRLRKRLLLSYLLGPLSFVFVLRDLAPHAAQQAAPLVPIYSFGVYCLFFLVPLTLRANRPTRKGFRDRS